MLRRFSHIQFLGFVTAVWAVILCGAQAAPADEAAPSAESARARMSSSVTELAQSGKHFEAVVQVLSKAETVTTSEKDTAAHSAWALGLVHIARELWDSDLRRASLSDMERARVLLAYAIMELQEKNFDAARVLAEKAMPLIPGSDLRSQLALVTAEALREKGMTEPAAEFYRQAAAEGSGPLESESYFLLGENRIQAGKPDEARQALSNVDSSSTYFPAALKRLIRMDFEQGQDESMLARIRLAQESYPQEFSDSWTRYALVHSLCELGRGSEALAELDAVEHADSSEDVWLALTAAEVEANAAVGPAAKSSNDAAALQGPERSLASSSKSAAAVSPAKRKGKIK